MSAFASAGPTAYWYLTRATGWVALLLLTAVVVLGVLDSVRFSAGPRWPRFAIDAVHRDVSLLSIVFLVIHIVTTVLDGFAPISLIDAVIPFRSPYRPLWLGMGAVSFDLILAVLATSLVRRRLGYGAWRAIHWLAYASWPVAVLHSLGTGSDVKTWWMLLLTVVSVAAVVVAVLVRVGRTSGADPTIRTGATAFALGTPVAIAIFALVGPLSSGWARRAGTPSRLLPRHAATSAPLSRPAPAPSAPLDHPFSASLTGTASQEDAGGGSIVQLMLHMSGGLRGVFRVRLGGTPIGGGGLSLTGSQVDLSAAGQSETLQGQIVSLEGTHFVANLRDSTGRRVSLQATLNIDQQTDAVTGTMSGRPSGGQR
jgi:sulfoxide reductase heme-binding subunit YedZ